MNHGDSEHEARHISRNKRSAESKLRRSPRNCPVCLAPLEKIAPGTRIMRMCSACRAHPSTGKSCLRCGGQDIWEGPAGAACRQCGLHGAKTLVIVVSER